MCEGRLKVGEGCPQEGDLGGGDLGPGQGEGEDRSGRCGL